MNLLGRIIRKGALMGILAVALIVNQSSMASATTAKGGGTVAGEVHSSGVPLDPGACQAASYTFTSTTIAGTWVTDEPTAAAGTLSVTAHGSSSGCETSLGGTGTVTLDTCAGSGVQGMGNAPAGAGLATLSCSLSGGYTRTGAVVDVELDGTACINSFCATVHVTVVAWFQATATASCTVSPTLGCVVTAEFAGGFVLS